jgi:hypothetical protein
MIAGALLGADDPGRVRTERFGIDDDKLELGPKSGDVPRTEFSSNDIESPDSLRGALLRAPPDSCGAANGNDMCRSCASSRGGIGLASVELLHELRRSRSIGTAGCSPSDTRGYLRSVEDAPCGDEEPLPHSPERTLSIEMMGAMLAATAGALRAARIQTFILKVPVAPQMRGPLAARNAVFRAGACAREAADANSTIRSGPRLWRKLIWTAAA